MPAAVAAEPQLAVSIPEPPPPVLQAAATPLVPEQAPRALPPRPVRGLVTEFTLAQITVYDRPFGQRLGVLDEREFPRTGSDPSGVRGVPIYAVDGGVIEVALPGGKTGWINKAAAVTTVPPCQTTSPARSAPGKGGHVARGAGEASC